MSDLGRGEFETGGSAPRTPRDEGLAGRSGGAEVTVVDAEVPASGATSAADSGGDDRKEQVKEQASQAKEQARDVAANASDQTRQVAGTAKEGAHEVVDEANAQVSRVANEATNQVSNLVGQATDEVRSQANAQTERAAGGLHTLASQFGALADGRAEEAGPAADYARQITSKLDQLANRLEQRGIEGMTDDLQRFARRRPGQFLAGAAAAGFLASRLFRGNQAAQDGGQGQQGGQRGYAPGSGQAGAYGRDNDIDLRAEGMTVAPTITGGAGDEAPLGTGSTPLAADAEARRQYGGR